MRDSVSAFVEKGTIVGCLAQIGDASKDDADFTIFNFLKRLEIRLPSQ